MKNIAVLTAGGVGSRMNQDIPKQFLTVDNKPVIIYTLEIFENHPEIDSIVVACLEGWEGVLEAYAKQFNIKKLKKIVKGGEDGQGSIKNCLDYIASKEDPKKTIVLVHDGNRPMLSHDIISNALVCCRNNGNAIAAIPCPEVLLESLDGKTACGMIERDNVKRTQTPHVFYLNDLLLAHKEAEEKGLPRSAASCSLFYMLGRKLYFIDGSEKNLKLTTVDDIDIFNALLSVKRADWLK